MASLWNHKVPSDNEGLVDVGYWIYLKSYRFHLDFLLAMCTWPVPYGTSDSTVLPIWMCSLLTQMGKSMESWSPIWQWRFGGSRILNLFKILQPVCHNHISKRSLPMHFKSIKRQNTISQHRYYSKVCCSTVLSLHPASLLPFCYCTQYFLGLCWNWGN